MLKCLPHLCHTSGCGIIYEWLRAWSTCMLFGITWQGWILKLKFEWAIMVHSKPFKYLVWLQGQWHRKGFKGGGANRVKCGWWMHATCAQELQSFSIITYCFWKWKCIWIPTPSYILDATFLQLIPLLFYDLYYINLSTGLSYSRRQSFLTAHITSPCSDWFFSMLLAVFVTVKTYLSRNR